MPISKLIYCSCIIYHFVVTIARNSSVNLMVYLNREEKIKDKDSYIPEIIDYIDNLKRNCLKCYRGIFYRNL